MLSSSPSPSQRDMRHELDSLMEEAGDVVFRLNQQGQVLFASKRAVALIGCTHDLQGEVLAAHVCDLDRPALKSALDEVLQSLATKLVEIRIKTPELEIWHELRVSCYINQLNILELLIVCLLYTSPSPRDS